MTQGRSLTEAKEMVADLVKAMLGVVAEHLSIDFMVALGDELLARFGEARQALARSPPRPRRGR